MLQALFAYFIPSELRNERDPTTRRRARLAVLIPLVGTGPLYALPFYLVGFEEGAWVCLVLGSVILTAPWLLRWTGSLPLVGHLLTGLTLLHVVLLLVVTGGVSSVMVPWLVNAVLVALLLMGRRSALRWLGVAVAIIGATYGLTRAGLPFPNRIPTDIETAFVAVLQLNNTLIVFGMAFLLDQENERTARTLSEAQRKAERAATRIEGQAEHLARVDAAKSKFFANLSHEFRTPLTLALGVLESWVEGDDAPFVNGHGDGQPESEPQALPEAARRDLRQVLLNNRRLLRLVNQLLDLAELESGTLALDRQSINLQAGLNRVADAFVGLAERRGIAFRRALPNGALQVFADPDHLETILANLLSNAFKHTPEGGTVTLRLVPGDEAVRIQVADTGPGIPESEQDAIFDRFHQSGAVQGTGTGIGLSLTKALVERHGGSIAVESTVGEGSTFTVRLPRGTEHLTERPDVERMEASDFPTLSTDDISVPTTAGKAGDSVDAPEPPPQSVAHDRTTILVVDDNADIRSYVRRHLTPAYRVVEAADGQTGLKHAREWTPDCVVSDVMMPRMDGVEMLTALRADPATDFLPVIFLTAKAAMEDKLEGLDAGADDYLTKPFRPDELTTRIRNLIAQRMRLRERFRKDGQKVSNPSVAEEPTSPFLKKVQTAIREHIGDEDLTVSTLANEVGASRSKLYRKLRAVTDSTPGELIWEVRLDEARRLLKEDAGNVSEVAYGVGFKSVSHFTNRFRERYGELPSVVGASAEAA